MKLLFSSLLFLASPLMAHAVSSISTNAALAPYEEVPVDYISWCEDNKVMQTNQNGDVIVRADCTELRRTCKTSEYYRHARYIVTAMCEAQ